MDRNYYHNLADNSIAGTLPTHSQAEEILTSKDIELFSLLNAAYDVRRECVGKSVTIHIINNGQNGHCPEDCSYCAQAKSSNADIDEYPLKSDAEFLAEAKNAYEKGAHRYCMVFAGRGPSKGRVEKLANLIRTIKSKYQLEICVSAGLLDRAKADVLKDAGLDRLNHNLNTSSEHYAKICTTHTYQDRLNTLNAARSAGIQLCSGVIIGMNETPKDVIEVAYSLQKIKVESIPVNFLMPIEGNPLDQMPDITPEYCLRALCLYRFVNPRAEIRMAAGREIHLRNLEVLGLFPANSLFLDGYLNTKGNERLKTLQMIRDAGFTIESNRSLDEILGEERAMSQDIAQNSVTQTIMKGLSDLRPEMAATPKKQ